MPFLIRCRLALALFAALKQKLVSPSKAMDVDAFERSVKLGYDILLVAEQHIIKVCIWAAGGHCCSLVRAL